MGTHGMWKALANAKNAPMCTVFAHGVSTHWNGATLQDGADVQIFGEVNEVRNTLETKKTTLKERTIVELDSDDK